MDAFGGTSSVFGSIEEEERWTKVALDILGEKKIKWEAAKSDEMKEIDQALEAVETELMWLEDIESLLVRVCLQRERDREVVRLAEETEMMWLEDFECQLLRQAVNRELARIAEENNGMSVEDTFSRRWNIQADRERKRLEKVSLATKEYSFCHPELLNAWSHLNLTETFSLNVFTGSSKEATLSPTETSEAFKGNSEASGDTETDYTNHSEQSDLIQYTPKIPLNGKEHGSREHKDSLSVVLDFTDEEVYEDRLADNEEVYEDRLADDEEASEDRLADEEEASEDRLADEEEASEDRLADKESLRLMEAYDFLMQLPIDSEGTEEAVEVDKDTEAGSRDSSVDSDSSEDESEAYAPPRELNVVEYEMISTLRKMNFPSHAMYSHRLHNWLEGGAIRRGNMNGSFEERRDKFHKDIVELLQAIAEMPLEKIVVSGADQNSDGVDKSTNFYCEHCDPMTYPVGECVRVSENPDAESNIVNMNEAPICASETETETGEFRCHIGGWKSGSECDSGGGLGDKETKYSNSTPSQPSLQRLWRYLFPEVPEPESTDQELLYGLFVFELDKKKDIHYEILEKEVRVNCGEWPDDATELKQITGIIKAEMVVFRSL